MARLRASVKLLCMHPHPQAIYAAVTVPNLLQESNEMRQQYRLFTQLSQKLSLEQTVKRMAEQLEMLLQRPLTMSSALHGTQPTSPTRVGSYPLTKRGEKTRVLLLIKFSLATEVNTTLRTDIMLTSVPSIWVQLGTHVSHARGREAHHGPLLFAAVFIQ
jgi:hypothetical protein